MLALLSNLSMFVVMGFLLCGAIVVPHDQKHWAKVALIGLAIVVGWRSTGLHGALTEWLDVTLAGLLLWHRKAVWAWMLGKLSRGVPPAPAPPKAVHSTHHFWHRS